MKFQLKDLKSATEFSDNVFYHFPMQMFRNNEFFYLEKVYADFVALKGRSVIFRILNEDFDRWFKQSLI